MNHFQDKLNAAKLLVMKSIDCKFTVKLLRSQFRHQVKNMKTVLERGYNTILLVRKLIKDLKIKIIDIKIPLENKLIDELSAYVIFKSSSSKSERRYEHR